MRKRRATACGGARTEPSPRVVASLWGPVYIGSEYMRKLCLLLGIMIATIGAGPQDDLLRARQLYNEQLYNLAIDSAAAARRAPQLADTATLILLSLIHI